MTSRRQLSLCSALIAVLLGLALFAGSALAAAQPIDSQENSVQSSVDGFVSYLKSETNDALMAAARIARENKDTIDEAKARIGVQIDAVSAALSSRKERLKTFGNDASAMWEEWRETAASSWAKIERQAHDALDWIAAWIRTRSLSDRRPEIPV